LYVDLPQPVHLELLAVGDETGLLSPQMASAYLAQIASVGYHMSPLEVDARRYERDVVGVRPHPHFSKIDLKISRPE
jgi:hypothetical protein